MGLELGLRMTHRGQRPNHAHHAYIQANNQSTGEFKLMRIVLNFPKNKTKICLNVPKKLFPTPTPKSHNVLIGSGKNHKNPK